MFSQVSVCHSVQVLWSVQAGSTNPTGMLSLFFSLDSRQSAGLPYTFRSEQHDIKSHLYKWLVLYSVVP